MPVAAVLGAAVIGGATSIISGNRAANATTQAAQQSEQVQRYMYDTTRADYAPWRTVGQGALGKLARLYGIPTETAPQGGVMGNYGSGNRRFDVSEPDWYNRLDEAGLAAPTNDNGANDNADPFADFYASPDYQFRLSEGMKAIERSAAARGGLRSGATMRSIGNYSQGVAAGEYGNYVNRLAALAGVGQSATDSSAQAGQNYANAASNAYTNAGNARASSYANTGNAINGTVQNLAGAYLYGQGYGG